MPCIGVVTVGARQPSALQNFRKPFHYCSFTERLTRFALYFLEGCLPTRPRGELVKQSVQVPMQG